MATNLSWGQIRLLLQQFAGPGVKLDTIDQAMNARYELILGAMNWQGIVQSGMIQTANAYGTGSITATFGSANVVGNGTNWTSTYSGWQLFLGEGPVYTVTITGPTTLTLDRPFEGISAGAYWLAPAFYALPDNCRTLRQIFSPWDGSELQAIDQDVFGELEGDFLPVDTGSAASWPQATNYIPWTDGLDPTTGQTVQRILIWPVPILSQGYPIKYEAIANGFDGTSTTSQPLAFISANALIAGCKADLELHKEAPNQLKVQKFEDRYQELLLSMIHIENNKHPEQRMRMDPQYHEHRMARFLRSGGPIIAQSWLMDDEADTLPTGAGTPQTDTFSGTGTQALFVLSQIPVSPPVVLVNNVYQIVSTAYLTAGKLVTFLSGYVPANGAQVKAIYTY